MTTIAAFHSARASAENRAAAASHAVAKIKGRAQFDGEYAGRRQPKSWSCPACEKRKTSQSGTSENASFWDAPRLKSEFAAQVLGQALGCHAPDASAAAAYRKIAAFPARLDKAV